MSKLNKLEHVELNRLIDRVGVPAVLHILTKYILDSLDKHDLSNNACKVAINNYLTDFNNEFAVQRISRRAMDKA